MDDRAPFAGAQGTDALKLAPLVPLAAGGRAARTPVARCRRGLRRPRRRNPWPLPSGAIEAVAPAPPGALEDMIASAMPAVVLIESSTGRGTGFFVKPDLIVTNAHVVRGSATVMLRFSDGRTGSAAVSTIGEGVDLATLRPAPGSANPANLELSTTDHIRAGQEVIAIGSALGVLQNTVTRGIISAIRNDGGVLLLQTDAAINPGNSGGPLLDRSGRVVGVNTMKIGTAASIGFAIAADHVLSLLDGRGGAIAGARRGRARPRRWACPPVPAQQPGARGIARSGRQRLRAAAESHRAALGSDRRLLEAFQDVVQHGRGRQGRRPRVVRRVVRPPRHQDDRPRLQRLAERPDSAGDRRQRRHGRRGRKSAPRRASIPEKSAACAAVITSTGPAGIGERRLGARRTLSPSSQPTASSVTTTSTRSPRAWPRRSPMARATGRAARRLSGAAVLRPRRHPTTASGRRAASRCRSRSRIRRRSWSTSSPTRTPPGRRRRGHADALERIAAARGARFISAADLIAERRARAAARRGRSGGR